MGKDGYSREGFFGEIIHYDSKGHKIGESRPSFFGGYNNYDSKGNKIGETRPGFFGYNTYDNKGHKTGSASPCFLGTNHYDSSGHRTGTSMQGFLGTNTYDAGSNATEMIGKGSAAAALERDESFMMKTSVAGSAAVSNTGRATNIPKRTENTDFSQNHKTVKTEEGNTSATAEPSTIRYVICHIPEMNVNRNYKCDDPDVRIGDFIMVSDHDQRVEVLAVVQCEASAAPALKQRVLYR